MTPEAVSETLLVSLCRSARRGLKKVSLRSGRGADPTGCAGLGGANASKLCQWSTRPLAVSSQPGSDADNVLKIGTPVHLASSARGGVRRTAPEESLLFGLAVNVRFLHSRHQMLARPQSVLPLTGKSYLLGRNALEASQGFRYCG